MTRNVEIPTSPRSLGVDRMAGSLWQSAAYVAGSAAIRTTGSARVGARVQV